MTDQTSLPDVEPEPDIGPEAASSRTFLVVAVVFTSIFVLMLIFVFFKGVATHLQMQIINITFPLVGAAALTGIGGSITSKARGLIPGVVMVCTGGIASYILVNQLSELTPSSFNVEVLFYDAQNKKPVLDITGQIRLDNLKLDKATIEAGAAAFTNISSDLDGVEFNVHLLDSNYLLLPSQQSVKIDSTTKKRIKIYVALDQDKALAQRRREDRTKAEQDLRILISEVDRIHARFEKMSSGKDSHYIDVLKSDAQSVIHKIEPINDRNLSPGWFIHKYQNIAFLNVMLAVLEKDKERMKLFASRTKDAAKSALAIINGVEKQLKDNKPGLQEYWAWIIEHKLESRNRYFLLVALCIDYLNDVEEDHSNILELTAMIDDQYFSNAKGYEKSLFEEVSKKIGTDITKEKK